MTAAIDRVVDAVSSKMLESNVVIGRGAKSLHEHSERRRVVWIWTGGQLERPRAPGGRLTCDGDQRITPLLRNRATVECHIMAATLEALEALWADVLNAVALAMNTASAAGRYELVTETQRSANVYGNAAALVQLFEWDLVLARSTDALTNVDVVLQLATIDHTL